MSFKNLFIKKQEIPQPKSEVKESKPTITNWNSNTFTNTNLIQDNLNSNNNYQDHFDILLKDSNQPGPDFLEFTDAVKQLDGMALNEAQKFIATFPTYASMGITAQKLIESGLFYVDIVNKEQNNFNSHIESSYEQNVKLKEEEVKKLQTEMEDFAKKVQEKASQIQNLTKVIEDSKRELKTEQTSFDFAYQNKLMQLNENINKIKTYLLNDTVTK